MGSQVIDAIAVADEVDQAQAMQPVAASPLDLPADQFRSGLDRRMENRKALMEWVRSALVEGVDFGSVPTKRGPSKPSLWKPGAEKICGMLGVTVSFPTLKDYEKAALHGVELVHIIIRCEVLDASGRVVADGVGARSIKQDYGDINKALKMAEKSAHIDATLRMAGLSEVFTQDLEDMIGKQITLAGPSAAPSTQQTAPSRTAPPARQNGAYNTKTNRISEAQHRRLEARINELGLSRDRVKDWLKRASRGRAKHFPDMTKRMYERLDSKLEGWAEREAIQQEADAQGIPEQS